MDDDAIDLVELTRAVRHGWWRLALGGVLGVALAVVVLWVVPSRWEGKASVLVTRAADAGGGLLQQAGIPDGLASSVLGRAASSQVETELELLRSALLAGEVTDALGIFLRVTEPAGLAHREVGRFVPSRPFKTRTVTATREGSGWRLRGTEIDALATAGAPTALPIGELTVAAGAPERFTIKVMDVEDAVKRVRKRTEVTRAGGDVAGIRVRWEDAETAAGIANGVVAAYLDWRRRTDRGDNALLAEFIATQSDSLEAQLADAVTALRRYQEQTGATDAGAAGGQLLALAGVLRQQRAGLMLEREALASLMATVAQGGPGSARQLAAFPTFLRSPGINDLLSELVNLETRRLSLLPTRTVRDADVQGLAAAIANLEGQLLPLAQTYREALDGQLAEVRVSADSVDRLLSAIPGQGEAFFRLRREVERLAAATLALQSQRLQLRLATIGEGGRARAVDAAIVTKKAAWPPRVLTLALGGLVGVLLGVAWAFVPVVRARELG